MATNAERAKKLRERDFNQGFIQVNIRVPKHLLPDIKALVECLREKTPKQIEGYVARDSAGRVRTFSLWY